MKPELYLHIPTPCHEDWDKMSPNQQGRFCQSCSKTVVDFSLMTDHEVLNFFKNNTGNTCGRFYSDQLTRPLTDTKIEKRKSFKWAIASMLSFFIFSKAQAQKKIVGKPMPRVEQRKTIGDTIINCPKPIEIEVVKTVEPKKTIMTGAIAQIKEEEIKIAIPTIENVLVGKVGGVQASYKPYKAILKGRTIDETGKPIAGVTVEYGETKTATDINGEFAIYSYKEKSEINFVSAFHQAKNVKINITKGDIGNIILEKEVHMVGEVVFASPFDSPVEDYTPSNYSITGTVVDQNNNPIPYASIKIKSKHEGSSANKEGLFNLNIKKLKNNTTIIVSSIGYEDKEIILSKTSNPNLGFIQLQQKADVLKEVVVASYDRMAVGKLTRCYFTKVTKVQKVAATINKTIGAESFKIYPNPAKAGSVIQLQTKETGEFTVQIFSQDSKLLQIQNINLQTPNQPVQIQLPNAVSTGMLYIKLVNEKSKKQWVNKVVVSGQ